MVSAPTALSAEPSSTGRTAPGTAQSGPGATSELTPREVAAAAVWLSPRARDVLALGSRGLTAREIGRELGISHRTVETYCAHAMERLQARNFTHAVVLFDRLGRKAEVDHG